MSDGAAKQLLESLLASLYSAEAGGKGLHAGKSYLVAGDGQYLGRLTTNSYDKDSILNIYGPYGSQYSPTSVFNKFCPYGGSYGQWSAENQFCQTPPSLFVNGAKICSVSENQWISNRISFNQFVDVLKNRLDHLLAGRLTLTAGGLTAPMPVGPSVGWGREARIMAADGTFLGNINTNAYDQNSIFNDYGPFGGQYSRTSIFNEYGSYGGQYASGSPFNQYTSTPPSVFVDGKFVAYLTVNQFKSPRIDPNHLKSWASQNGF